MVYAAIYFSGKSWLWPAAGLVLMGLLLLARTYRQTTARPALKWSCSLLKLLGLTALALCLADPQWVGERAKPGANLFLVLADNSQSLQVKDPSATQSRGDLLRSWLTGPASSWQGDLEENFQVRRYNFDQRLQPTKTFEDLDFQGEGSALRSALESIADRFHSRPVAGILIFTDGNVTDLVESDLTLPNVPPLYPVVAGLDQPIRDLAIDNMAVTQTAFEDAPVTIQADVSALGYSGKVLVAELWPVQPPQLATPENQASTSTNVPEPPPAETLRLKVTRDEERLAFRFQIKPEKLGISFYRVRVGADTELDALDEPSSSQEATLLNNERWAVVDRGRGPYRILYVGGRPNWEFKFLNRALDEETQVQLTGLLRIARREPKFEFKGRQGESSNPLFRGFDRKTEETERYDQPVLVWFNPRDETQAKGGFPKIADDLFSYHALILDDLESGFFTHDQMNLIHRFVSERGGALLMLGGPDSFQAGQYERTPIGDLLPVYLDSPLPERPLQDLRLSFSREGWLQPWIRLRPTEGEERSRLESMPAFQVLNTIESIKPGATVLATLTDQRGKIYPAMVVQRFGLGRVAALLAGDLWRWGFLEESMRADMDKAWRQTMRWLVADVPPFVQLSAEPAPFHQFKLRVQTKDRAFRPLDNAEIQLEVRRVIESSTTRPPASAVPQVEPLPGTDPNPIEAADTQSQKPGEGQPVRLGTEPLLNEAGTYEASYVARHSGAYLAEASVKDPTGVEVGHAAAGWTSDPAADEFAHLQPNRALLENLAQRTGGRLLDPNELAQFVKDLPFQSAPINESWSYPLWHQAVVFLFALLCFLAEWALRRWRGLA